MVKVRSRKLRQSAMWEACTFQIPGVCTHNNEETVLCHINVLNDKGWSTKPSDLTAAFGCSECHRFVDNLELCPQDSLFYTRRAISRTIHRWVEMGLISVEGFEID
jgi:hypothetical protein